MRKVAAAGACTLVIANACLRGLAFDRDFVRAHSTTALVLRCVELMNISIIYFAAFYFLQKRASSKYFDLVGIFCLACATFELLSLFIIF